MYIFTRIFSLSLIWGFITCAYSQDLDNSLYPANSSSPQIYVSIKRDASVKGKNDGIATVYVEKEDGKTYTYHWNTNPPQFTPTANKLPAGMHVVTVTDNLGNSVTEAITIVNQMRESSLINLIKVYPNPSNGQISVDLAGMKDELVRISLFNAVGKKMYDAFLPAISIHKLDFSNLTKGLYYLKANWREHSISITKSLVIN